MSSFNSNQNTSPQPGTPLKSTLANDPDMAELVQFFVEEMSDRLAFIQEASQENDFGKLRTVAHQLKGAATGYGFEPISQTAAELEALIDETQPTEQTDDLRQQVDALIDLCRCVSA